MSGAALVARRCEVFGEIDKMNSRIYCFSMYVISNDCFRVPELSVLVINIIVDDCFPSKKHFN